jgi:hypothetical protein
VDGWDDAHRREIGGHEDGADGRAERLGVELGGECGVQSGCASRGQKLFRKTDGHDGWAGAWRRADAGVMVER